MQCKYQEYGTQNIGEASRCHQGVFKSAMGPMCCKNKAPVPKNNLIYGKIFTSLPSLGLLLSVITLATAKWEDWEKELGDKGGRGKNRIITQVIFVPNSDHEFTCLVNGTNPQSSEAILSSNHLFSAHLSLHITNDSIHTKCTLKKNCQKLQTGGIKKIGCFALVLLQMLQNYCYFFFPD